MIDQARIDANWVAIDRLLDVPERSRLERILLRARLPEHLVRTVGATPALRRSWFVAVAVVAVLGLGATDPEAADPEGSLFALLLLAPLVPVLGVALAYGPGGDPSYEATMSTPAAGLKLVLWRTVVVTAASGALLGVVSVLSPVRGLMVLGWVLPSLSTAAVTLAASSIAAPRRAAAAVSAGWLTLVMVARAVADDRLAAFHVEGQLTAIAVALVSVAVAAAQRERFATACAGRVS